MKTREYPPDWASPKWEDDISIEWVVDKTRDPYRWWLEFKAIGTKQSARIHFATISNPVPDMVAWLDYLAKGHPTGVFRVDEEGWVLRFCARPLPSPDSEDRFELRIEDIAFLGFDEEEDDCEVFKTKLLAKVERKPFVAAFKRILLDVVKIRREEVEQSPTGNIEMDGWCFGMRGKRWCDVIARLDEIETE